MNYSATALASSVRALCKTLTGRGIDPAPLLAEAGLDAPKRDDPGERYPLEKTTKLWRLAVAATGDEALGLAMAANVGPTSLHALGYALLASATLHEAIDRVIRYFRVVADVAELELQDAGDGYRFVMHIGDRGPQPAPEAVEGFVYALLLFCRQRLERPALAPRELRLRRPPPAQPAPFLAAFGTQIAFGADENIMVFDREDLDQPLEGANPELARINDEVIERYLARHDRDDVINRVRAKLSELLPLGEPSQEKVAAALHTTPRNLQRKLAQEGTSYSEILADTRRKLAESYLDARRHSVSEVAFMLGFADLSAFTRAFRRWHGMAPSEWRDRATKPAAPAPS